MGVKLTNLENGMTVVSDENLHFGTASIGVWVKVGSRSEELYQHGITHLLEHMAFKGTKTRTAHDIVTEIESVGGELNASTSVENTAFFVRIMKEDVELAIDILADIMLNAVICPNELNREKHVVIQEIGANFDSPEEYVGDLFLETVWPDQAIGRSILGTVDSVKSIDVNAIKEYMFRHYRAPSMVLASAGAINHEQIVKLVGKKFKGIPTTQGDPIQSANYIGGEKIEVSDLHEVQFYLGFEGFPYGHNNFYAVQMLASILGGGMSSRLFQVAREERGLCYSIYASHLGFEDTGLFAINAATGNEDINELMSVICEELLKIEQEVTEDEMAIAKAQIKANLMMTLESPSTRSSQIARQVLVYGRVLDKGEIFTKLDAINEEDISNLAKSIFSSEVPTLTAVGPVNKTFTRDKVVNLLRNS